MYRLIIVATLILTGVTCGDAIAHSGATGIVKELMDYFNARQSTLKKSERTLVMKVTLRSYRWPIE